MDVRQVKYRRKRSTGRSLLHGMAENCRLLVERPNRLPSRNRRLHEGRDQSKSARGHPADRPRDRQNGTLEGESCRTVLREELLGVARQVKLGARSATSFHEWGFPTVSKLLQARQWLGAWMLDTIWTELCSRIDSRRSRTKLITLPNPLFRCMFQVTKDNWPPGDQSPLWSIIPLLQNEEKIGNIFECLATYYIMHKCWDGVRCIVRTAFEVQGGECMKCGDFTMISKLHMYARDHKLLWVERNLPKESTMAGELLRAAIPSLLYISQMTPNSRNGFIEYYRSRFQIEIPQVEVRQAGESRLENFQKTTEATTYGRGLTREEKLYMNVPWPIRPWTTTSPLRAQRTMRSKQCHGGSWTSQ